MKLSKLIVSAATTVTVVAAIGFAYAQTPPSQNDKSLGKDETPFADHTRNLNNRNQRNNQVIQGQDNSMNRSAPAPAPAPASSGVTSYNSSNSSTGALGAAPAEPTSERMARADRN